MWTVSNHRHSKQPVDSFPTDPLLQHRRCPQVLVQVSQISGTLPVQLPPYLHLQSLIGCLQIVDLESTNHRREGSRRKQSTLNKFKCFLIRFGINQLIQEESLPLFTIRHCFKVNFNKERNNDDYCCCCCCCCVWSLSVWSLHMRQTAKCCL